MSVGLRAASGGAAAADSAAAALPAPWPVRMRDVVVRYPNGVTALDGVSLALEPGEMVAVVGLSGSGKSSMIRTLNGLVPVTSGTVEVGGHDVTAARGRALRALRGEVGMIFQSFNLAGRATVLQNVLVGRVAHAPTWRTLLGAHTAQDKAVAYEALDRVGMLDRAWHRASHLSGGQQQQLAIGRALASRPRLLILDEPTEGIQPSVIKEIGAVIRKLAARGDMAILLVEQFYDFAAELADHYMVMARGEIIREGRGADMEADGVRGLVTI